MATAVLTYKELNKDIQGYLRNRYPTLTITRKSSLTGAPLNLNDPAIYLLALAIKQQPFFPNKPQFTVTINDIKILINGKNANVGGLIDLFATKMGIRKK
jgi:hypothetical protein